MAFLTKSNERIAMLIDAANLSHSLEEIRSNRMDYGKLLRYMQREGYLVTARYYTAVVEEAGGYQPLRTRLTWLAHNGYHVVEKPAINQGGVFKGNMDAEMVCDMFLLSSRIDRYVLFTGDGDFARPVLEMQNRGCRVEVVSSEGMTALRLKQQADSFVDLRELISRLPV